MEYKIYESSLVFIGHVLQLYTMEPAVENIEFTNAQAVSSWFQGYHGESGMYILKWWVTWNHVVSPFKNMQARR